MVILRAFPGVLVRVLALAVVVGAAVAVILPLIWMVISSLKVNQEFLLDPFGLPGSPNFGNYADVWGLGIGRYLFNSAVVTGGSIVATTLVSAWAAFGLTKVRIPFAQPVLFVILGGLMLTPMVALVPLLRLLQTLGIYDTLLGLIILYTAFRVPFTTFLIRSYMIDLAPEVDEAALLDGCTPAQRFWRVTRPMSVPIIVSSVILQALFAWNEFLFAFIFISSNESMTLPVGLANLSSKLSTNYPMVFAGMTISAIPMIVFFFLSQRFFVRGLAEGVGK